MGKRIVELLPILLGVVGIVIVVRLMPEAVKYLTKASGTPADLVINFEGVLGEMPVVWRNLAQGGEEAKSQLSSVVEQTKALRPEYIRIDHIYDAFNVVSKRDGHLAYDWSKLDEAIDEIVKTGAKPFISLSYMPSAISTGDILALPVDMNDWGEVVKNTVEHFSGRANRNLDGVIYEVWNEPDLFGGFKTYGDKNYLALYEAAARGAMRANNVNRFEIGGPAITALYDNWVKALIESVDRNNLRMDFLSWHRYSRDIERFEKDSNDAREMAQKIPALANLKYYVTEWGHNSEVDPGYDTVFGAIHTLVGARVMMGKVDRAFVFEIKDGPGNSKNWGRWGLLTHEKWGQPEIKPRYSAIQFLNSLYKFRLSLSGEGSFVKGISSIDESGRMKTLVVNYDPEGKHSEAVPIMIENLPQKTFKYTRKDFLGKAQSYQVATDSASWKVWEFMNPNSAMMIEVEF